jgi:thiol-disulfide isomerase/thioredoxin
MSLMQRRGVLYGVLALLAGASVFYVTKSPRGNGPEKPLSKSEAGDTIGAFVRKPSPEALPNVSFQDGNEKPVTLESFKGRVVLLNLWATWCLPCRKEMPALDRLQAALGGPDFEVVALSIDRAGVAGTRKFLESVGVSKLKLYADPTARLANELKAIGLPTTLLLDRQGREIGRLIGPAEWDEGEAKALVEKALIGR